MFWSDGKVNKSFTTFLTGGVTTTSAYAFVCFFRVSDNPDNSTLVCSTFSALICNVAPDHLDRLQFFRALT